MDNVCFNRISFYQVTELVSFGVRFEFVRTIVWIVPTLPASVWVARKTHFSFLIIRFFVYKYFSTLDYLLRDCFYDSRWFESRYAQFIPIRRVIKCWYRERECVCSALKQTEQWWKLAWKWKWESKREKWLDFWLAQNVIFRWVFVSIFPSLHQMNDRHM